jgi:hypothetical protein
MLALHYMHYNFVRIHQTLRVTPAMAAGVTDRLWSVTEMVDLLSRLACVLPLIRIRELLLQKFFLSGK